MRAEGNGSAFEYFVKKPLSKFTCVTYLDWKKKDPNYYGDNLIITQYPYYNHFGDNSISKTDFVLISKEYNLDNVRVECRSQIVQGTCSEKFENLVFKTLHKNNIFKNFIFIIEGNGTPSKVKRWFKEDIIIGKMLQDYDPFTTKNIKLVDFEGFKNFANSNFKDYDINNFKISKKINYNPEWIKDFNPDFETTHFPEGM